MTPEQRHRIIISQRDALKRNGYHPNALFWSDKAVQELRFQILAGIGIENDNSLLDVGCGFGDFAYYLEKHQGIKVLYTGIDISNDLLAEGRKQYPNLELLEADLFEFISENETNVKYYDYVIQSGMLNRKFMGNNGAESAKDYSFAVIQKMFETCKKGIAFNLLDARHEWTAARWDLQSFYPDEILELISTMTDNFKLIDNYLDNDFTIYAWP